MPTNAKRMVGVMTASASAAGYQDRSSEPAASFHPAADIFPLMTAEAFDDLVADIKENGLIHPIVEMGNAVLDGRNRYLACIEAGVPIRTVQYKGADPVGYVLGANLHRRHLTGSQRAMIASKLITTGLGRPNKSKAPLDFSAEDAAQAAGVSMLTVSLAKTVNDSGNDALIALVERGLMAVDFAAKVAKLEPQDQATVLEAPPERMRTTVKQVKRQRRERDLAEATRAASKAIGTKLYGVIYADPPWRFEPYSRETGLDRAADNHYGTMRTADIRELEVPAADNAVLFLWATVPMLPEALSVMDTWGFTYKTNFVWTKNRIGTGYWARNRHEHLLIGTRGDIPAPAPGEQFDSVIEAPVGKHSSKPAAFAKMIEELFPSMDLLEMFARGPRSGWDTWGNEATSDFPASPA
jgi:N6-adenosine-specific RNA methylase IME4